MELTLKVWFLALQTQGGFLLELTSRPSKLTVTTVGITHGEQLEKALAQQQRPSATIAAKGINGTANSMPIFTLHLKLAVNWGRRVLLAARGRGPAWSSQHPTQQDGAVGVSMEFRNKDVK